jgi:hypothetical protein
MGRVADSNTKQSLEDAAGIAMQSTFAWSRDGLKWRNAGPRMGCSNVTYRIMYKPGVSWENSTSMPCRDIALCSFLSLI